MKIENACWLLNFARNGIDEPKLCVLNSVVTVLRKEAVTVMVRYNVSAKKYDTVTDYRFLKRYGNRQKYGHQVLQGFTCASLLILGLNLTRTGILRTRVGEWRCS